MARPLREDYPGAWHHIMNRSRNREKIFFDDDDAVEFLDSIGDTAERFDIEVHAFSLMPNHYHLLVRSRRGNISDAMKHLGAVYTQTFTFGWRGIRVKCLELFRPALCSVPLRSCNFTASMIL